MSIPETKFSKDQKVVYPSQGVGKIVDIFEKQFKDKSVLYYKIYLDVSDMIVMIPVDRAEEMGIRSIVSSEEAQKALNMLSDDFEPITSDWKLRYQMNLDLLKKGSISDIATIVRCLYHRSKVKELPILERKLYDNAKKLLEDEIAFAMGKTAKEVENMIHSKLEPPGAAPKVKAVLNVDNDDDEDFIDDISSDSETDNDSESESDSDNDSDSDEDKEDEESEDTDEGSEESLDDLDEGQDDTDNTDSDDLSDDSSFDDIG